MVKMIRSAAVRLPLGLGSAREDERGQAMVEYALIIFLVSIVAIAILGTLGQSVSSMFSDVVVDF